MTFELRRNEPAADGIRRIAREQIDLTVQHLLPPAAGLDEAVHDARRGLKRLRALAALVRGELGEEVFEREAACFRDAGRRFAEIRDAAVLVETFDAVAREWPERRVPGAFGKIRLAFSRAKESCTLRAIVDEDAFSHAAATLVAARDRVAEWPLSADGFGAFRRGLRRTYRCGRRGLAGIVAKPSPASFHDWRKPVKMLWHQLQVLGPTKHGVVDSMGRELNRTSELLNDNHDLDVLREALLGLEIGVRARVLDGLFEIIDTRCRALEDDSTRRGHVLFSERAGTFVDRIERHWTAGRTLRKAASGLGR
jgi:CHAD domain-containing protein